MTTKASPKTGQGSLKMYASRRNLTPIDRLAIRLGKAQSISANSVAAINLVSPSTVADLTKGLPKSAADIREHREALRRLVAADTGLDLSLDHDLIEGLITAGCRVLAQRIEDAAQSRRGRVRFDIAEAA